VKDFADLYKLDVSTLANLERMGEKSAENLVSEIAASKKDSLDRLIYAIGIPFVGERTAQLLASHFGSMDRIAGASAEELMEVGEVGPKIAEGVREFFSESANRKLIERLKHAGVNMKEERKVPVSAKLAGKTFVFTGTLANRTREEAEALVASHGGKAGGSVSKKTNYVVVGADPGSKFDKAKTLGVPILSESQFERLLAAD
jgi:DNA ligase (NAD+)